MSNTEHLTEWESNIHANNPDETGCIKKHASKYSLKKYPRCNYRKNAHDFSKANETHIYNIPNMRSPERWVNVWKTELDFSSTKAGGVHKDSKSVSPDNEGWYLDKGKNFTTDKVPFWHNTHHCISCGEILENFESDEWQLIIATGWNINENENAMILPKQFVVARMLKLPTHVPPDGKQNHDSYSEAIGGGLQRIKSNLSKNEDDENGHKITDDNAPDCRTALENLSKELRKMLIKAGEKNPGVNIDNLDLDSINWDNVLPTS